MSVAKCTNASDEIVQVPNGVEKKKPNDETHYETIIIKSESIYPTGKVKGQIAV